MRVPSWLLKRVIFFMKLKKSLLNFVLCQNSMKKFWKNYFCLSNYFLSSFRWIHTRMDLHRAAKNLCLVFLFFMIYIILYPKSFSMCSTKKILEITLYIMKKRNKWHIWWIELGSMCAWIHRDGERKMWESRSYLRKRVVVGSMSNGAMVEILSIKLESERCIQLWVTERWKKLNWWEKWE